MEQIKLEANIQIHQLMMTQIYNQYIKTDLTESSFKDNCDMKKKLDNYMHLTLEEYEWVLDFAISNSMKKLSNYKFKIVFDRSTTQNRLPFCSLLKDLEKRVKNLATATCYVNGDYHYSVFLYRKTECKDYSNVRLLERWELNDV